MAEGGETFFVEKEGNGVGHDSFDFQFGVGRGFARQPSEARTPVLRASALDMPQLTSTQYVDRARPSHAEQDPDLGSLITQLAAQLGESIVAQLQHDRNTISTDIPDKSSDMSQSNVKFVMQSDAKEPPIFRGDGSDRFTVHEWENLMTLYLKKRHIPVHEQSQEILARLMGKAGDVVRIKMRNNTAINHSRDPHMIFDILKQHFSELTYSNMPLADFYNTLPAPGEDAMEYWIRLNKTVDVADECLKRRGRSIDDPSHEVSMMFIKHCPDQSLASVFKYKSAEKWSACEIQERLDEHMQEKKTRAAVIRSTNPSTVEHKVHSQCQVSKVDNTPVPNVTVQPVPLSVPSTVSCVTNDCMKSLVTLLDQLVTQQTQVPANFVPDFSSRSAAPHSLRKVCRVCGASAHSTVSHCRRENRCLKCLTPGHWKKDCPQQAGLRRFQPGDSAGGQNQQLN